MTFLEPYTISSWPFWFLILSKVDFSGVSYCHKSTCLGIKYFQKSTCQWLGPYTIRGRHVRDHILSEVDLYGVTYYQKSTCLGSHTIRSRPFRGSRYFKKSTCLWLYVRTGRLCFHALTNDLSVVHAIRNRHVFGFILSEVDLTEISYHQNSTSLGTHSIRGRSVWGLIPSELDLSWTLYCLKSTC